MIITISRQDGTVVRRFWVRFQAWHLFCVAFACSPRVCVGSLSVLQLPGNSLVVHICVCSCLSLCGLALTWRLVQGVTLPLPYDSWERLQAGPCSPAVQEEAGAENGCLAFYCYLSGVWRETRNLQDLVGEGSAREVRERRQLIPRPRHVCTRRQRRDEAWRERRPAGCHVGGKTRERRRLQRGIVAARSVCGFIDPVDSSQSKPKVGQIPVKPHRECKKRRQA